MNWLDFALEHDSLHHQAKAKQVIFLYMDGGPSQVDTFDPKPALARNHGKPLPQENLRTERKTGPGYKGFRFHAAPVKVKAFGTFPVRAYAVLDK